ncbi:MAG: ATP-binding protein, partial [Chloroflexi bacterium]|nr:ATP-binding protein [Chloroflexota bacterium]
LGLTLTNPPMPSTEEANHLLTVVTHQYPTILHYGWISPAGVALASSNPAAIGMDISDRPYFRRAAEEGHDWAVSELLQNRVGGEPAVFILRGIRDDNGVLLGVAFATLDPKRLDNVFRVQRSGQGAIALFDRRGELVYRSPSLALSPEQGEMLRTRPAVLTALAGHDYTGSALSVADGQRRMMTSVPIRSIGWAVMVSRPEAEVMAPVLNDLLVEVGLTLLLIAVAIAPALLIARSVSTPLHRLLGQAQAFAWGDFKERADVRGPPELQHLAEGFNRMAGELERHEQQREMYIHTVSHDLRAPLTVIQGRTQMLLRLLDKAGLNGAERESVEAVLTSARGMNVLIEELVESAQLEAGQTPLRLQPLDLAVQVYNLWERLAGLPGAGRIQIRAALPKALVQADPDRLDRIFTNLLTNALKYSAEDSEIAVTLRTDGHEAVVTVADRGPGIPPEDLPHLFRQYHRTRAAQERHEGVGLGLFITKRLVEAHGGRIWVESAVGQGSAFSVALPCIALAERS